MFKLSLVAVLLTALFATSYAIIPGGKCSALEYIGASQACVTDYSQDLKNVMKPSTLNQTLKDPIKLIETIYTKACKSGLIKKSLQCQKQVNKMCEYSVIAEERLESMVETICVNIKSFSKYRICLSNLAPKKDAIVKCFTNIMYKSKVSDPLCALTEAYRGCIKPIFSLCSDNEVKVVFDLIEDLVLLKCSKSKTTVEQVGNRKCSASEYLVTSTMCWAPYGMKMVKVIGSLPKDTKPAFALDKILCKTGELSKSIECQKRLDSHCEYSIVNMNEVSKGIKKVCEDTAEVLKVVKCLNPQNAFKFFPCLSSAVKKDNSICDFSDDVRKCYAALFTTCGDKVSETMRSFYDVTAPKSCSSVKDGEECSTVEYAANLGLCWTPIVMDFVAQPNPNSVGSGPNTGGIMGRAKQTCSGDQLKQALRCHKRIDDTCKMSVVKAKKVGNALDAVCDNMGALKMFGPCLRSIGQKAFQPCTTYSMKTHTIDSSSKVCSLVRGYKECTVGYFKGKTCDKGVTEIMSSAFNTVVPDECSRGTSTAKSAFVILMAFVLTIFRAFF